MTYALSSGCFMGHETSIRCAALPAVELSSHRPAALTVVLDELRGAGTRVVGLHTPCPNHGHGLDPGASADAWPATEAGLLEAGALARDLGASYVLAHAFYCTTGVLPADDLARMQALRAQGAHETTMREYVCSELYLEAKQRTIDNLRSMLPRWRRLFPHQQLVLENLNPRHGYGGILFQDVADIASALDGDIGVCLDVGHLTLSEAALETSMRDSVVAARPLIRSAHIHQNFAGRYCIDRFFSDAQPRAGLQDVDAHLPLGTQMWHDSAAPPLDIGVENSAFRSVLRGSVQFSPVGRAVAVEPLVRITDLLPLIPSDAFLVLEADARYVPLDVVLASFRSFERGEFANVDRESGHA